MYERPKPIGRKKNGALIRTSQGMRGGWRAQCTPPIRRNSDPCQVPRKPVRAEVLDLRTLRTFTGRCIPSRIPKGAQSGEVLKRLLYILFQQGRYSTTLLSKLILPSSLHNHLP